MLCTFGFRQGPSSVFGRLRVVIERGSLGSAAHAQLGKDIGRILANAELPNIIILLVPFLASLPEKWCCFVNWASTCWPPVFGRILPLARAWSWRRLRSRGTHTPNQWHVPLPQTCGCRCGYTYSCSRPVGTGCDLQKQRCAMLRWDLCNGQWSIYKKKRFCH